MNGVSGIVAKPKTARIEEKIAADPKERLFRGQMMNDLNQFSATLNSVWNGYRKC